MIEVKSLDKRYGFTHALKEISFSVQRGEVVGFLGPNGAGKTTTMKILTGYLLPTGGHATVGGLDVVKQSLAVRRRIGYLPESTPLYGEMRVDDYLRFVAEIRGVPKGRRKAAIARAVELCSLKGVLGKNIVELSKGFRQRVGLAQAMVHEPEVMILDEPTSGLDPNQIVEVRHLIAQLLGEQRTVILSTHYLQEVEKTCSRVIIITQGKIVADDTQEQLIASLPRGAVRARIRGPEQNIIGQFSELLPGKAVEVVERQGDEIVYRVGVSGHSAPIEEALARLVVKNGWALLELGRERGTLEDVFRNLTTQQPVLQQMPEAAHA